MKLKQSWSTFFQETLREARGNPGKVEFGSQGSIPQCVSIPSTSVDLQELDSLRRTQ